MDTSKTIICYKNENGLENAIFNVQSGKWLIDLRDKLIQLNAKKINSIIFDTMDSSVLLFRIDQLTIKQTDESPYYVVINVNNGNPILELFINSKNILYIIKCINDFFLNVEPRHTHIILAVEEHKDIEVEISFREREVGQICYRYAFIIKRLEDFCKEKTQTFEGLNEILDYYMNAGRWEKNVVKHYITTDTIEQLKGFVIKNDVEGMLTAKLTEIGININLC